MELIKRTVVFLKLINQDFPKYYIPSSINRKGRNTICLL